VAARDIYCWRNGYSGHSTNDRRGSIAGAVSIPTRHLHQVIEMAHKDDIQGSIDLLVACVSELDKYDWSF